MVSVRTHILDSETVTTTSSGLNTAQTQLIPEIVSASMQRDSKANVCNKNNTNTSSSSSSCSGGSSSSSSSNSTKSGECQNNVVRIPTKVEIEISVKDQGIGIATEVKEKLFQEFFQADISIARKYGGSGNGLSLSISYHIDIRLLLLMYSPDIFVV